jgi:hypothetical protein
MLEGLAACHAGGLHAGGSIRLESFLYDATTPGATLKLVNVGERRRTRVTCGSDLCLVLEPWEAICPGAALKVRFAFVSRAGFKELVKQGLGKPSAPGPCTAPEVSSLPPLESALSLLAPECKIRHRLSVSLRAARFPPCWKVLDDGACAASDVWAVGAIAYILLGGRAMFVPTPEKDLRTLIREAQVR